MLRVKDYALARELWIRLEEDETTFAEAARQFGEGPSGQAGCYWSALDRITPAGLAAGHPSYSESR